MQDKYSKNEDKSKSNFAADMMRGVSYGYYKKNEWLQQQLASTSVTTYPSLSIKAIPYVLSFSSNYLEEDKTQTKLERFEKASIATSLDVLLDKILGAGPVMAVDAVGLASDFASSRLGDKIKQIEGNPSWYHPELEVLYEGKAFFEGLRIPRLMINGVKNFAKELVFDTYHYLFQSSAKETVKSTNELLNKLSPHAAQSLNMYSDYLLNYLNQNQKNINSLQDVFQNPAFQNELHKLQLSEELTKNQSQLLTLYIAGRYTQSTQKMPIATPPNASSLQKNLAALETAITHDLSQKVQSNSLIFCEIQDLAASSLKLLAPDVCSSIKNSGKEQLILANRLHDASYKIGASSQLLCQVASLTGNHKIAGKIGAIGSGTSELLAGASHLAVGNIFGGIIGIGGGICSFVSGLFGKKDKSLSVLSHQVKNVHEDMIEGFNHVLLQQTQLARSLSSQLVGLGQATMSRFDHVDTQLQLIDYHLIEGYKQLITQQNHISSQITHLSQQLNDTERTIVNGLQQVHSDLIKCMDRMGQGIGKGLIALSSQFDTRLIALDQNVHKIGQELSLQIAENRMHHDHFLKQILFDLKTQNTMLQAQNLQIAAIQHENFIEHVAQYRERQRVLQEQNTHYAVTFLQQGVSSNLIKLHKLKLNLDTNLQSALTGGDIELSSESMCKALGKPSQWEEIDPFNYINLLRRFIHSLETNPEFQKNLIHFPVWQKNCEAYIKWGLEQEQTDPLFLHHLQIQTNTCRELVTFLETCAQPFILNVLLAQSTKNIEQLSTSLLKQLHQHQKELNANFQAQLLARLQQNRLEYEQFKINDDPLNENLFIDAFTALLKEVSQVSMDFFSASPAPLSKPIQYFIQVNLDKKKNIMLPWSDKQLPYIPKPYLALETMGLGLISCEGRYDPTEKKLHLCVAFKLKGQEHPFILGEQTLPVPVSSEGALKECIMASWQNFVWDDKPLIEHEELTTLYNTACTNFRIGLNNQTHHDFFSTNIQKLAKDLDVSSGMMHVCLRLLFESFYRDNGVIPEVISTCINSDQIQQLFTSYAGEEQHFLETFSQIQLRHQSLLNRLLESLEKHEIYVENLRLNNALLLLDNLILQSLDTKEKIAYLDKLVTYFPNSAISNLLYGALLYANPIDSGPKALALIAKAQSLRPDDNQVRLCYASYLTQAAKYPEAIQEFSKIIEGIHDALEKVSEDELVQKLVLSLVTALIQRGNACCKANYFAAALADYEKAIILQPDNLDLLYRQAYCLECLGYAEKAVIIYQDILKLDVKHVSAIEGLARCLRDKDPEQALSYYTSLLKRFPRTEFKIQCALLTSKVNPSSATIKDWLFDVAKDRQTSKEDLLLCCELSLQFKYINTAHLAFALVKNNLSSKEELQRGAEIAKKLNNTAEWANLTRRAMNASPAINSLPKEILKVRNPCSQDIQFSSNTIRSNLSQSFFNHKDKSPDKTESLRSIAFEK